MSTPYCRPGELSVGDLVVYDSRVMSLFDTHRNGIGVVTSFTEQHVAVFWLGDWNRRTVEVIYHLIKVS